MLAWERGRVIIPKYETHEKRPPAKADGRSVVQMVSGSSEGYSAMKLRWTAGSTLTPGPIVEVSAMLFT